MKNLCSLCSATFFVTGIVNYFYYDKGTISQQNGLILLIVSVLYAILAQLTPPKE
jgi:hypothetical protein